MSAQHDESAHPRAGDGRFTTKSIAEADDIDLDPGTAAVAEDEDRHQPADPEALVKAARLFDDIESLTRGLVDAVEERNLVDEVLAQYPDADTIVLRGYDAKKASLYEHGPDAWMTAYDSNDGILVESQAPFRPEAMRDHDGDEGHVLDVAEVVGRDFDAIRIETEQRIIDRLGAFRPPF